MDNVSPAHRCISLLGVVPVGLGDGVGLCRDAASFPGNRPLISLVFFLGNKTMPLFQGYGLFIAFAAEYASSQVGARPMLP